MRSYIRHPTNIPIQVSTSEYDASHVRARNLSAGGLCFTTMEQVRVGARVDFWIPVVQPEYQGSGVIVWRRQASPKGYEVGVRFTTEDEYFRARMVEQVCLIEDYRQRLALKGRMLTSEQAALEWIARYAADFAGDKKASLH